MKIQSKAEAEAIGPDEVISILNGGIKIVDEALPVIKVLFDKIAEAFANIGKNSPNSPANRLKRIQALEAKDKLQKELNKVFAAKLGLTIPE